MESVTISRRGDRWAYSVEGHGAGMAESLLTATRAVHERIGTPPGQNVSVQWNWSDPFVEEALAVNRTREQHRREKRHIDVETRRTAVSLADRGLTVRDIAQLLGISTGLVSTLTSSSAVFGDPGDGSLPVQVVDLLTDAGAVTRHGYGDLPHEFEYEGVTYEATGGSHQVGGGPEVHTYVPVA